jgi:hypothetical protein
MKRGRKRIGKKLTPEQEQQQLGAVIAAWMLNPVKTAVKTGTDIVIRPTRVAINILLWRSLSKQKRARARAHGMSGLASKPLEADMRWLFDEATPQEQSEVFDMIRNGLGKQNVVHVVALQSYIAVHKEKGDAATYKDAREVYDEIGGPSVTHRQLRRIYKELGHKFPRRRTWKREGKSNIWREY